MTQLRALGSSGLSTPALVLGGNVFGWTADEDRSFAVLDAFMEAGGRMVDTADVYSAWVPQNKGGESEGIIGRWIASRGRHANLLISTKVGLLPGRGGKGLAPDRIAAACEESLDRLGVDCIDLYFSHKDDLDTPLDEVMGAFAELVSAGKVKALGASQISAERLREALDASDRLGLPRYSVIQPELNLVRRADYEGALQDLTIGQNLGVIPFYGLASGFLTGKYRSLEDLGKSPRGGNMKSLLEGRGLQILAAMDVVAAETGATLAQIALAWNAAQPGVTAPIASATSVDQLAELMGSLSVNLSADQLARLDGASR